MVELLGRHDWDARVEVTYDVRRVSGSIDIVAWHAATRTLLVIEIKTEVTSAEATLRKLDEKARLGAAATRERFGWTAASVAKLLVIEETSTNRRRVAGAAALFDAALPVEGRAVRRWLARPTGTLSGRLFLSVTNRGSGIQRRPSRHRLRRVQPTARPQDPSLNWDQHWPDDDGGYPRRTILVG